ncbi:MAG: hypothetical protein ACYDEC_07885 [Bacteroidia bacterium]
MAKCDKKKSSWRLWCTFFASFLWASKEMKIKDYFIKNVISLNRTVSFCIFA